jgi:hypothetical protein
MDSALLLPLFPLKLMEAPLQHVILSLAAPQVDSPALPLLSDEPSTSVSPGQTWLPTLGKFLPDTWLDETVISNKAAKSDDDQVPEHLWDNRATLVLPQLNKAALTGFRKFALIWQRRYMYRQFRAYLREKFGPDWLPRLLRVWQQAKTISLDALTSEVVPPPPKRGRQGGILLPRYRLIVVVQLGPNYCCIWMAMQDVK